MLISMSAPKKLQRTAILCSSFAALILSCFFLKEGHLMLFRSETAVNSLNFSDVCTRNSYSTLSNISNAFSNSYREIFSVFKLLDLQITFVLWEDFLIPKQLSERNWNSLYNNFHSLRFIQLKFLSKLSFKPSFELLQRGLRRYFSLVCSKIAFTTNTHVSLNHKHMDFKFQYYICIYFSKVLLISFQTSWHSVEIIFCNKQKSCEKKSVFLEKKYICMHASM